jgi:hypothetical protein
MKDRQKRPLGFHPFFFALFPIFFLYSEYPGFIDPLQLIIPCLAIILFTITLWFVLYWFYRDHLKSAMSTSLFLVLFFSYGLLFSVEGPSPGNTAMDPYDLEWHIFPLATWVLLFFLSSCLFHKMQRGVELSTLMLNAMSLILLVIPLSTFIVYASTPPIFDTELPQVVVAPHRDHSLSHNSRLPDIYYIMLDGYARSDLLEDLHSFDNNDFLTFLTGKGFQIAQQSTANYCQTMLALAASLNMTYFNDLENLPPASRNRESLRKSIQDNHVFAFLRQFGYKIVSFRSGVSFTDTIAADSRMPSELTFNEFHHGLIDLSPLPIFLAQIGEVFDLRYDPYSWHRKRINYTLDHLPDLPETSQPQFVFAHILAPHPPFVFGPNGESIQPDRKYRWADGNLFVEYGGTTEEYLKNYKGQVEYLNKRFQVIIEKILAKSSTPPIIILQADHGSRLHLHWNSPEKTNFHEAFSNFSAFYLPKTESLSLAPYQDISPVNTFRLIFNQYFGANYEILKNESYYSPWDEPYHFTRVTEQVTTP